MLFSVIDTETTGLDITKHEIIQLGLIEYSLEEDGGLNIIWEHEFKFKPQNIKDASPAALKINGYNPARWVDAEIFDNIVPMLDRIWSTNEFLLGQNLIFDLRFITKSYYQLGIKRPKYPPYLDTKYMGNALVNEGLLKSSSMDNMCKELDIKFKGQAHTALTDCQRTVTLWERLQKHTPQCFFTYENSYDPYKKK